jgi:hypothetical protein
MQANPNEQFDREYENLTDKQRAVIDAHAQNPDETNREKARIAGEEILGMDGPVNESYSSDILNNKYPDLADYRAEIEQNERFSGQEQTKGDPLEALNPDNNDNKGFQGIQDRPVKGSSKDDEPEVQQTVQRKSPIQVFDTGESIAVEFSYRYVEELLRDQGTQLPDDLHQQLVNVIFQRVSNAN